MSENAKEIFTSLDLHGNQLQNVGGINGGTATDVVMGDGSLGQLPSVPTSVTDLDDAGDYVKQSQLSTALSGKQDSIPDIDQIRVQAANGSSAYQVVAGGIEKSAMSASVQASLDRADMAILEHQSLANYYTKAQTDAAIDAEADRAITEEQLLDGAIQSVQTDVAALEAKVPTMASASNKLVDNAALQTAIANFVTVTTTALVNYYTKAETYSKDEVDAMFTGQFTVVIVDELPEPSQDTLYKIYLVPSDDPEAHNIKEEYITVYNESTHTYSWEGLGNTAIDLSDYSTTQEVQAMITNALSANLVYYYTKVETDALLAQKQDIIADLSTIRSNAAAGATAYQKPNTGIPKSDLSSGVKASLDKADTALQFEQTEGPASPELVDEYNRLLSALYQALTDAGASIAAADEAASNANAKAAEANRAAISASAATTEARQQTAAAESAADAATRQAAIAATNAASAGAAAQEAYTQAAIASGAASTADASADAANAAADTANLAAQNADEKAQEVEEKALYAQEQGDYAKEQGDYARVQAEAAKGDFDTLDERLDNIESTKQDNIADLSTIRSNAANGQNAYTRIEAGLLKTDLSSGVQTSLGKADTAVQPADITVFLRFEANSSPLSLNN